MAAAAMAVAEASDGPVMSMMNKRLRALRKKYNRIVQMEESLALGRSLNKEQEETLRSKPAVAALIDEYEKLRQPLSAALQEELSLARPSPSPAEAEDQPEKSQSRTPPQQEEEEEAEGGRPEPHHGDLYGAIEDLLHLLYFGCLFDVRPQNEFASMMFARAHERQSCLTYDYVTDDSTGFLREDDLDLISSLGGLITSRAPHSEVSHKNALLGCVQHAKFWLSNSDQPVRPGSPVTYAGLRERLNRILASDYFTRTPELMAPVDVVAAMGKLAACQVQVSDSAEAPSPSLAEDLPPHYEDEDYNPEKSERNDSVSTPDNDSLKDVSDLPNTSEDVEAFQQEHHGPVEGENRQEDADSKEQHHGPQRAHQNPRGGRGGGGGGGRRSYANGRGGRGRAGGYQNGRSQYYDPGYYLNNYYAMGRGGRDDGSATYNHVGTDDEHDLANIELGASS